VAEQLPETVEAVAENPLKTLGAAIAAAAPQGAVTGFTLARGGAELAIHANRDQLLAVMLMLRDDPRFAFEQCMDICGVDWPERAERFEVVYNLLSLAENRRIRVSVTTDGVAPVPPSLRFGRAPPGMSARPGTCMAWSSPDSLICAGC